MTTSRFINDAIKAQRYGFRVEWLEPHSGLKRLFNLYYYVEDGAVELFDVRSRKTFLKRSTCPEKISLEDFCVGNCVTVFTRALDVLDYLDERTRQRFAIKRNVTCAIVKPDAYPYLGHIIQEVYNSGLELVRLGLIQLTADEISEVFRSRRDLAEFNAICDFMSRDAVAILELSGQDAVATWQHEIGPRDPKEAMEADPDSLRARYGTNEILNAVHGSLSDEDAAKEIEFLFNKPHASPATFDNCTAVIIKPHAVREQRVGSILQTFLDHDLEIADIRTHIINPKDAADFFASYRGVLPEQSRWVETISEGKSISVLIRGQDAVNRVRELCGPYDPSIAKHIAPQSLRAKFGIDSIRNAVHCTDLPRDGPLECKFLFHVAGR